MYYSSSARWNAVIILVLAILLVIGIIYGAEALNNSMPYVPKEFTTTRAQAAQTSDAIVSLADTSITNLNDISTAYNAGDYNKALDIAIQEINSNNQERDNASILSTQLGTMANDLYQIRPESAEQIGVQAIGKEYQIIENLVDYSDLIYKLLDQLKVGYISQTGGATSTASLNAELNKIVDQLNSDAQSVNSLNKQYLSLMNQFDSLTK
ncbi:MAG: hypothetical protein M1361_01830 [Patescibacteria group bacterium]|nr:hypothetical protein [Patescibacteria group bacterium]MCL5224330.1 hypothetical protein [Patescibacteria group bacterium]